MDTFNDIQGAVAFNLGKPANLEIARADERLTVPLRPRMISERDPFGNKSARAVIGIRSDAPVSTAVGHVMALKARAAQTWEIVRLTERKGRERGKRVAVRV